ncbi:uncharacterized protein A1O9_03757 [Exophiala aquamarina CBS 119918]|uniref:Zn(2)-C6 fungal-type domain-containing protein n=1 Tax=Exophiala aquamarina CBS 119918 TaxID=1182545 RepID=A0A072PFL9_9EURO|nr:uncharacterized protein A1O9_03757 [Exophiala aquamarina CBS 119918]KEF58914.1 hypothetical protein A1O9_03757 [Exophiala aquamarina CBS 119918]
MEQPPSLSANSATTVKRKRASQACRNCRIAKRRCDAARPACSSCANSRASRACVYDDPEEAKSKQSKLIERLQQRITDLERADEGRKHSRLDFSGEVFNSSHLSPQEASSNNIELETREDALAHPHTDRITHNAASMGGANELRAEREDNLNRISSSAAPVATVQPSKRSEPCTMSSFVRDESQEHDSANPSHSQPLRLSSASAPFEQRQRYLNRDKELPPNDEIGVVAPRFGYFGDSSAVTFMSQVRSVLDNADDPACHYETEPLSPAHLGRESPGRYQEVLRERLSHATSRRHADFELYALPSREHADALLDVFWTWVHSLYPYLDRLDFEQKYEKIWLSSKASDGVFQPVASVSRQSQEERSTAAELTNKKTFYCTLNIAFALGCQFDPALNPGESRLSDVFWQRAKTLIEQDFNIFNEGSVSLIQALLLFGVYMQSTELSGGCWTVANVATSVAQVNGLHQINSGMFKGSLSQKELDLRKRVWSGCILLDR